MISFQIVFLTVLAFHLAQAKPQPDGSADVQPSNSAVGFKLPIPCSVKQQLRTKYYSMMSDSTMTVKTFFDKMLELLRSYPETVEAANKMDQIRSKKQQHLEAVKGCFLDSVKDNQTAIDLCNTFFPKFESDDSTFSAKCNDHYEFMHQLSPKDKCVLHSCMHTKHNADMSKSGPGMMPSAPNSASFGQPFPGAAFGGLGPMAMSGPHGPPGQAPAGASGAGAPAGTNNIFNTMHALRSTLRAGGNPCELIHEIMEEMGEYFHEHPGQCPTTTDGNAANAPAVGAPAS